MTEEFFSAVLAQAVSAQLSLTGLLEAATQLSNNDRDDLTRQLYHAWIDHNPDHPQLYVACFNCSSLDSQAQDKIAAAAALEKAIALDPDFIPAYINLGRICEDAGSPERAIELWQTALSRSGPINGSSVLYATTALTQMARLLSLAQQSEKAEEAIYRCLEINPRQADVIEQYTALRLAQCKWPIAITGEHLDRKALVGGINPLSMAAYTDDPLLQLASAYRYVKRAAWDGPHDGKSDRRHAAIDLSGRRLRVGYVSSDLRDHAVGYLMAELFELHNKHDVEVFAYYCGPQSDTPLNKRLKSVIEHWRDIRDISDDEAAARIAADGIDILVDVNGHTRDSKTGVFARRPAPIQVNWLGYPGSMGSPYHQYIIADDWVIPSESEIYYSEKVVRLPCYQPNDRRRQVAAEIPTRSDAGLPDNAFVFCCFNGTHKISRFTFERWLEILTNVPDSVLWLLDAAEQTKQRLRDFAEQKGVVGSRLIFAPKMPNANHLARYCLADLFLDSAPYGAHTTASDALWMGVPVLTLSGRSFASRVCGSLVRAAGLSDLVATNPQDYVARAIALAADRLQIDAYKTQLRANRDSCTLFDSGLLVRRLEELYRGMCAEHSSGSVPQPDLENLDVYFDAGLDHDHDADDVMVIADYHEMYRAKLKRFHLARPLQADSRLWRRDDILAADQRPVAEAVENPGFGAEETLARLETLLALRARGVRQELLLGGLEAVIEPATRYFNAFVAAGDVERAARYADMLAALLPSNVAALNAALSCNVALGRKSQASHYATSLVEIDPAHPAAREALVPTDAAVPEIIHPIIQLRDLYDQASAILCSTLTESGARQIKQLRAAASKITVAAPDNTELAGWEKHYRLAFKAIDISDALGPTPKTADKGAIVFASASGRKLDWRGVQAKAKKQRAKAVFFAAADSKYVDLYGRPYIESILDHCDVSSLIVLHVIGGAAQLPAIAKSLGISSDRLVFAGDKFDATSIKTRCYDAPPKGLSALPIAHLQSVRFLRVGALLQSLKLPVMVSDIDLVLQRGVSDLLEQFKDCDIVLNENAMSGNAGSRFTANLLLLNPTPSAALFLRFLRGYLEKALAGSEVSRWIDQFALMQARHHLMNCKPKARIGYFDVNSDINNLIYTAYQEHPYRFLSLYHGFDMSTLPRKSRTIEPARSSKISRPRIAPSRRKRA